MKKKTGSVVAAAAGAALLALGLYLVKTTGDAAGFMGVFPYVCVGIGSGAFGGGFGNIISERSMRKNPELRRQMEINKNDERNVAIANRAKARAYDIMVFVLGALMLSFALMEVETAAVLLLVFAYLVIIGSALYFRFKYDKEM